MWVKEVLLVQLFVLQNIISSQPVIENAKSREARQSRYEECCPCPGVSDGMRFRDQDSLPSQKSSFLRMPLDDCPCRSGFDNEGSSSIFYPSFLRGAQPVDRSQESKQEPKPLLQPEVGLASSVLETLKEATDEEYKDALLRDATRTALKTAEPSSLDAESGPSKHSVTIVINPRDLDEGNDAIPEASHAHETRCIHSPLRSSNFENSRRIALPRLSKEYLLLPKRKIREPLHKSLFDMDNSPSNVHENLDVLDRTDLGNKLKINPSLISELSGGMDELRNSWGNIDTKLRITPEQCDDLNRGTNYNSPMFTLAAFKNKLRDLREMRNSKRVNNNVSTGLYQNRFKEIDTEGDSETKKMITLKLPALDKVIDKQSPLVKNLLKLRDVELLPPRKTNIKDASITKDKQSDLKAAGTENKANIAMPSKIATEKLSKDSDIINPSLSDDFSSEEPKETKPISTTSEISSTPVHLPRSPEDREEESINDSSNSVIKSVCDEVEMSDSSTESDFKYNVKPDFQNEISNIDDEQNATADENIDSEPESTNILQQINQEDESTENNYLSSEVNDSDEDDCYSERFSTDSPINLVTDMDEIGPSSARESNQHSSLKNDILRKLENLRNIVKTKFAETEFDNSKNTQQTPITSDSIITLNENPVETKDLQELSDSLLNQEILSKTKSSPKKTECVINGINSDNTLTNDERFDTSSFNVNNNESSSSKLHGTNAQLYVTGVPSKNILMNSIDGVNTTLNPSIQDEISNLQIPESTWGTVSNESYEAADEDILPKNEMSSQASNLNYNALRPQFSDNHLRSSLPLDTKAGPLITKEKDVSKSFQIPTLEEIRQGITNIIDAGQREEANFRTIDLDPLRESSNVNLVKLSDKHLAGKLPNSGRSSPSFQRNSLMQRLNFNPYNNKLDLQDVASLRPLKLPSLENNRAGIFGDYLSSGKDKIKSLSLPKPALNVFGTSGKETLTLDKIRDSLNTNSKNLFREVPFRAQQLPISNTGSQTLNSLKNGLKSYADNSVKRLQSDIRDITVGNGGVLSKSKIESDNIFETIARRREDIREKLLALHLDFNGRKTIQDRLQDQTNLQSINKPVYRESGNVLNLPVVECEQENNLFNLISERQVNKEPYQFIKSKSSSKQDQKLNSPKSLTPKTSKTFYTLKDNDDNGFIAKQNEKLFNSSPLLNTKKLPSHKIERMKPPSNGHFKISFSSTTVTPVTKQRISTSNYAKKFPLGVLKQNNNHEEKNMPHTKLKPISNAYRSNINNYEDSKHSPSAFEPLLIQSTEKSLNVVTNLPFITTTPHNNRLTLDSKNAVPKSVLDAKQHLPKSAPLLRENQFVTNIREALRSRLANITPATLTSGKDKLDVPLLDAVESPSENLKTVEVLTRPLKENTSYKCTMMCVRE